MANKIKQQSTTIAGTKTTTIQTKSTPHDTTRTKQNNNKTTTATKDPGQTTFKFKVGMGDVIKGWDEGVLTMSRGEISKLTCSPDYAYGSGGFPAWGIMPNSELVFEIELLEFK